MVNRNLDGIYFNITRDGKRESVCFSDLTPDEREFVKRLNGDDYVFWRELACILADTLRNIGDQMDIYGE